MSARKNETKKNTKEMDADVLYQKLGDRWFAFSLIGDEVFMSPISEEVLESIKNETTSIRDAGPHEAV